MKLHHLTATLLLAAGAAHAQYAIVDNDWATQSYIVPLLINDANVTILGCTSVSGDTWMTQGTQHILRLLELANLSSTVPVVNGATFPLINTELRTTAWQQNNGIIAWLGAFAAQNLTAQAEGEDPSGGDPFAINDAALVEGIPTTTALNNTIAAWWMTQQVRMYPGQVSIYAAGAMTNVALAIRLDPEFASLAKELVIMGGFVDHNAAQIPSYTDADLWSDFNLLFDPEAAHIMLTAPWRNVTIAGNVANQQGVTQAFIDEMTTAGPNNSFTQLFADYGTAFPMWDETAAAILAYPDIVTSSYQAFVDVDMGYAGPFYGRLFVWGNSTAPANTYQVNIVNSINQTMFYSLVQESLWKTR